MRFVRWEGAWAGRWRRGKHWVPSGVHDGGWVGTAGRRMARAGLRTAADGARTAIARARTATAVGRLRGAGPRTATAVGRLRGAGPRTATAVGRLRGAGARTATAVGRLRGAGPRTATAVGRLRGAGARTATAVGRHRGAGPRTATAVGRLRGAGARTTTAGGRMPPPNERAPRNPGARRRCVLRERFTGGGREKSAVRRLRAPRGGPRRGWTRASASALPTPSHAAQFLRDGLLEAGYDIRTNQEQLGHRDVSTMRISTHVPNRGGLGGRSPLAGVPGPRR